MSPSLIIFWSFIIGWTIALVGYIVKNINNREEIIPKKENFLNSLTISLEKLHEQRNEKLYGKDYLKQQNYPQL